MTVKVNADHLQNEIRLRLDWSKTYFDLPTWSHNFCVGGGNKPRLIHSLFGDFNKEQQKATRRNEVESDASARPPNVTLAFCDLDL